MKRKVILTCAVSGAAPFNPNHPCFPDTPEKIAEAVIEAAGAGASIAHIHARDPETGTASRKREHFREIVDRVRQSGVDIVINLTAGHGAFYIPDLEGLRRGEESDVIGADERIAHLIECLPDIASIDVSTGNQVEGGTEFVYLNPTDTLRIMAKRFQQMGVKPELEAFGVGDILFANQLLEEGLINDPPLYQLVLGVKWASPADTKTVDYLQGFIPEGAHWGAMGIARDQMRMVAQSVLLGGNVRVGLEDNLYLERGVFATNGQLVERATTIINALGETVATPSEAREMLGLKKRG